MCVKVSLMCVCESELDVCVCVKVSLMCVCESELDVCVWK